MLSPILIKSNIASSPSTSIPDAYSTILSKICQQRVLGTSQPVMSVSPTQPENVERRVIRPVVIVKVEMLLVTKDEFFHKIIRALPR